MPHIWKKGHKKYIIFDKKSEKRWDKMNTASGKDLYIKISRNLLNMKVLEELNLDGDFIRKHIECTSFIDKVQKMAEENDYSCRSVLFLLSPMLKELLGENIPEDFLSYIYQFALSKSFPDAVAIKLYDELNTACMIYLNVLRAVSQYQMSSDDGTWQSKYALTFLTHEEEKSLENPLEYKRFTHAFSQDYIYEMMKLGQEVIGYNTLDHVCGVHYLALSIARRLSQRGVPVDLGRISGAAAGHDIGKFGCRASELKRVPYLHYYYTDQWFKKYDINYIRHIALNHSTWDLELENLPIESLILIYSDFRVKNIVTPDGQCSMNIFPLSDSFDIILKKLDNVDESKQKRYRRVYAKLKDFEDYVLNAGSKVHSHSLMQGDEIINSLKHMAIDHNIHLMHQFRDEFSLDNILQSARSQSDWMSLREYIRIFEEYSTYLTQKQKLQAIRFFYDLLVHPEDDIRRHCAQLIGNLIAIFDEDYRKEIPDNVTLNNECMTSVELFDEYLRLFLYPGHKIAPDYKAWIGYSTSIMVSSLFSHCRNNLRSSYKKVILKYYGKDFYKNTETQLYLLKIAECVPVSDNENMEILFNFVLQMLKKQNSSLRISALEAVLSFLPHLDQSSQFATRLKAFFSGKTARSKLPAENFLKLKAASMLYLDNKIMDKIIHNYKLDKRKIPEIFLSNLKTATDWVVKKIQVEILLEHTLDNASSEGLHTAIHFCNLLKVSAVENVRAHAGEAILRIMPCLPLEQRNEVAIELVRALEIEGYHFTEYIPHYLGQLVLWLQPVELNELIEDLAEKIKQSNSHTKALLLKTIGVCISNYPKYRDIFSEKENIYDDRLRKMITILLNALGDYDTHVKQIAFSIFGKEIFGSRYLSLDQKCGIFRLTAKKILNLLVDDRNDELLFLTNSAGLNHIYRFISDYIFFKGSIEIKLPEKVAFFPGTFDPFSLSHKQIVKCIRDMGFEVYLAIDEFSWSKRTLPNLLRRKIASISTADELDVYIYPENYPANIANSSDLKVLRQNFPNSDVYMVVGSDVILNASSYSGTKTENSIFTFPHIIINRETNYTPEEKQKFEDITKKIDGECIILTLPKEYVEISSTQIRKHIDESRDISSFIDPLAQQYIYEHGFYQREPQDKALLSSPISIKIDVIEDFYPELIRELTPLVREWRMNLAAKFNELSNKPSARLLIIRDNTRNGKLLGFSAFHWVRSSNLYHEFMDSTISEYIRKNTIGRTVLIDGIFIDTRHKNTPLEQILLTETLAFCLSRDYQCAVYRSMLDDFSSPGVNEVLRLQGFQEVTPPGYSNPVFVVNMTNPIVLNLDVETIIKEPFRSNPEVKQTVMRSRKNLQEALTGLYPGHLVLSFDISVQHELMIKKICGENGVPTSIVSPRRLGPLMCVPYGNILDRYIIPNTVTKALHTEKLYEPDMKSFDIGPFPHYLRLDIQAKTIHSFNRPVILVDDLLHKGYRIKAIDRIFKKENVDVQKIIVGILSGRGKEIMDIQGREVDSVYFLPRLRVWFNENAMYPFMGGDALWRGIYPERNLLPSINFILPYTSPTFIDGASKSSIYNMSRVAIENAIDILMTLENEYHIVSGKNLTLAHLGEVFIAPRCPDRGRNIEYDLSLNPSHFLKNDLEQLTRLEHMMR